MKLRILSILLLLSLLLAACATGATTPEDHADHPDETHTHEGDDNAEETTETVPNNGALVRLLSPENGATFAHGAEILVAIETENFTLGEDGNHWHIFIDGSTWAMIVGADADYAITGVEPGEHELSVYLANGDHQNLEDGATVTITVEE